MQRELPVAEIGLISVNEVAISNDLRNATVFVSFLGDEKQQTKAWASLRKHRQRIQSQVAQAVVMKNTPRLRFEQDTSVARGDRILQILGEIEEQTPSTDPDQE